MMLFFLVFLSYQPFYAEMVAINNNETLTNNIVGLMVAVYPYFWITLGILCLSLTIHFVLEMMS